MGTKPKTTPDGVKPMTAADLARLIEDIAKDEPTVRMRRGGGRYLLETLAAIVVDQLGPRGVGVITLPGLFKLTAVRKDAVPEHEGVNPFTRAPATFKARPASARVKVSALKALKDAIRPLP